MFYLYAQCICQICHIQIELVTKNSLETATHRLAAYRDPIYKDVDSEVRFKSVL